MRTYITFIIAVMLAVITMGCGGLIPSSYAHTTTVNGRQVTRSTGSHSWTHAEANLERNTQIYPACEAEMGAMPHGEEVQECTYEAVNQLRMRQQQRMWRSSPYMHNPYFNQRQTFIQPATPRYVLTPSW